MVQNEILKNKVNFQLQAIFTLNKRQTTNLFPMMWMWPHYGKTLQREETRLCPTHIKQWQSITVWVVFLKMLMLHFHIWSFSENFWNIFNTFTSNIIPYTSYTNTLNTKLYIRLVSTGLVFVLCFVVKLEDA